ncbi:MAG TPA: hypothetical protein VK509_02300, partial [Polyangiales bacterium]|nr:hypothetical protein [Polyangiales bacterium]
MSLGELAHDVAAVRFAVVGSESSCDAEPIASATSALETEALPASVAGAAGAQRPFADALFVLSPGAYRVCATPLAATGSASSDCARTELVLDVIAEQSNEALLLSQCTATGNGGLDVVVALNDPPRIDAVTLDPSKFITVCEALTISVDAEDPNGDEITYGFAVVSGPEGAHLAADGARATFFGSAGDYAIAITVTDQHGNPSSLTIPAHVSAATCEVPAAVQEILAASCGPCHTTGSSGGLRLSDAATSYASLVARPASAMACNDRVRV